MRVRERRDSARERRRPATSSPRIDSAVSAKSISAELFRAGRPPLLHEPCRPRPVQIPQVLLGHVEKLRPRGSKIEERGEQQRLRSPTPIQASCSGQRRCILGAEPAKFQESAGRGSGLARKSAKIIVELCYVLRRAGGELGSRSATLSGTDLGAKRSS